VARRQSSALRRLRSAWLLPLVITLICVVLVPRLVDGYASLQWTRYHAPRGAAGRRGLEHARQAVRSATRTLDLTAPLPWAREASELGLQASRRVESDGDRAAALELYAELRASLDQARSSPLRGLGLGGVAGEARSLEAAAATAQPGATK
jgi:hypothetical protein